MLPEYIEIVSELDKQAYLKGGFGKRMGFGRKTAIIVVDAIYAFIDPKFSMASGDMGIKAVEAIKKLLIIARARGIPVIYTRPTKNLSKKVCIPDEDIVNGGLNIVKEIEPNEGELILDKPRASAFFKTNLKDMLDSMNIDTLIICGLTTSGCVRATVVDAASYDYYVIVPIECVADRAYVPHKVNLFDMHMKYADVIPLQEVIEYIELITNPSRKL